MRKIIILFTALLALSLNANSPTNANQNMKHNVLVAYFSASGTTRGVAQQLADVAGADLKTSYPTVNWKDGKLLNHTSKAELQKWVESNH